MIWKEELRVWKIKNKNNKNLCLITKNFENTLEKPGIIWWNLRKLISNFNFVTFLLISQTTLWLSWALRNRVSALSLLSKEKVFLIPGSATSALMLHCTPMLYKASLPLKCMNWPLFALNISSFDPSTQYCFTMSKSFKALAWVLAKLKAELGPDSKNLKSFPSYQKSSNFIWISEQQPC